MDIWKSDTVNDYQDLGKTIQSLEDTLHDALPTEWGSPDIGSVYRVRKEYGAFQSKIATFREKHGLEDHIGGIEAKYESKVGRLLAKGVSDACNYLDYLMGLGHDYTEPDPLEYGAEWAEYYANIFGDSVDTDFRMIKDRFMKEKTRVEGILFKYRIPKTNLWKKESGYAPSKDAQMEESYGSSTAIS